MSKSQFPGLVEGVQAYIDQGLTRAEALGKIAAERAVSISALNLSYLRQTGVVIARGQRTVPTAAKPAAAAVERAATPETSPTGKRSYKYPGLLERLREYEAAGMDKAEVMSRLVDGFGAEQSKLNLALYRVAGSTYYRGALLTKIELHDRDLAPAPACGGATKSGAGTAGRPRDEWRDLRQGSPRGPAGGGESAAGFGPSPGHRRGAGRLHQGTGERDRRPQASNRRAGEAQGGPRACPARGAISSVHSERSSASTKDFSSRG